MGNLISDSVGLADEQGKNGPTGHPQKPRSGLPTSLHIQKQQVSSLHVTGFFFFSFGRKHRITPLRDFMQRRFAFELSDRQSPCQPPRVGSAPLKGSNIGNKT